MRRLIARACWRVGECCFRCGQWGRQCSVVEHRAYGTIAQAKRRRGVPLWLASLVHWRRAA